MVVGLTVIAAVVAYVLHRYVPPPPAVSVVLCPLHMVAVDGVIDAVGVLMVIFTPLSVPVTEGLLATTLILYTVPDAVPAGITALIVPEVVAVRVPMLVGVAKLPDALLN